MAINLGPFIAASIEHLQKGVDDANAELKGKAKVKLPSEFTLQVGMTQDFDIIRDPFHETAVAQLSCELAFTPAAESVETPAMKALAETTEKKETTKKEKGKSK